MQFVVAGAGGEHIVAVAGIDDVVAGAGHQHVIARGAGEGVAILIADGHGRAVAAAMVVVGGVGAVGVRCDVVGAGVVDGHGQLVVFRPLLAVAAMVLAMLVMWIW